MLWARRGRGLLAALLALLLLLPAGLVNAQAADTSDGNTVEVAGAVDGTAGAAKPLTYVAMGASDSIGVGAGDPTTQGWVPQLAQRLGPDTRLVDLGVYGTLLHDALSQQLPEAIAAQPDVVTVWLAVNDFNAPVPLPQYEADLDTLLTALETQTNARILVGNVPDLSTVPNYAAAGIPPILVQFETLRWDAAIAAVVARHNATLVDLLPYWQEMQQHPEYVSADGFHPSALGYARLADVFYQASEPVLAQSAGPS